MVCLILAHLAKIYMALTALGYDWEMDTFQEIARGVSAEIAPRTDQANHDGELSAADIKTLTKSGYTSLAVPKEYGGYGASMADCLAAQIELAQANPSTALVAGMNMQVSGNQRETHSWIEGKYAQICHEIVHNQGLINSVATEPALGSPSRGQFFKTTAVATDDGYRINGHKTWATGGELLTHLLVKLNIGDETGTLLVPQTAAGIRWDYTWRDVLAFRASDSHDVYFEDCWVSADALLEQATKPPPNVWFPMVMTSIYLGAAIGARNVVIQYALERVPTALGRPIATLPKIQRQIGEIDVQLQAARALLFEVAGSWRGDESLASRKAFMARVAAAKVMATNTARSVTDRALQVAGGISLTAALPLERYFRDVRAGSMQPPSGDTALELIGRAALAM